MSSTNRCEQRKESDFYETPVGAVRDFLQNNHEYAWFVWRPGVKMQKVKVIWGRLE